MKFLLTILLLLPLLHAEEVEILEVVKYPWYIECHNGENHYTVFKVLSTGNVFKVDCTVLGRRIDVITLPPGYQAIPI